MSIVSSSKSWVNRAKREMKSLLDSNIWAASIVNAPEIFSELTENDWPGIVSIVRIKKVSVRIRSDRPKIWRSLFSSWRNYWSGWIQRRYTTYSLPEQVSPEGWKMVWILHSGRVAFLVAIWAWWWRCHKKSSRFLAGWNWALEPKPKIAGCKKILWSWR